MGEKGRLDLSTVPLIMPTQLVAIATCPHRSQPITATHLTYFPAFHLCSRIPMLYRHPPCLLHIPVVDVYLRG